MATPAAKWFLRKPSEDAEARLFCFPYSGMGASMYRRWPREVGRMEVCPLQPPGRENRLREPPHETYEALAEEAVEALEPYLDRPFGFFGHCGGALPGFEATLRLAELGLPTPARLFVSSQVPPHEGPYGRFLQLPDRELAKELVKLMRVMGADPTRALIEVYLSVLRADVEANKRHRKDAPVPLPCPLTVIGWTRDAEVAPELMSGWAGYGEVAFALLEGEHYTFLDAPPALLQLLEGDLADSPAGDRAAVVASGDGGA